MKNIKEVRNIAQQAKSALSRLENGKEYPTAYVLNKFASAAHRNPQDQLIGNMRDVLFKRAERQRFFSQKELSTCYDRMYGLSGGHTAFRDELGEFLLNNRQLEKVVHAGSKLRGSDEGRSIQVDKNEKLSNVFASIFDLGNENSFGLYNPKDKKSVEKVVISHLNLLGMQPNSITVSNSNSHFALATAIYNTNSLNKVAVHIPVPIHNGEIRSPDSMISGGEVTKLSRANLLVHLKMEENQVKKASLSKFAGQHGSAPIQVDKAVVPSALMDYVDLENSLMVAASKFSKTEISMATGMLSTEFRSAGVINPQIKVASSEGSVVIFDVSIPTIVGRSIIQVPVEFHNNKPILPSKFAASASDGEILHDFTYSNIQSFVKTSSYNDASRLRARDTGELSKMSYHQLMDRVIDGVSTKDYKLSEDSLYVIQSKFGAEQHKIALNEFANLLKISSSKNTERADVIKRAFKLGYLINRNTSVEPYCPKLGLPLSKIDFDKQGLPYPKYRNKTANNDEETLISSSRILFT
jgi:transcriptional regulator with XRE-family HTH domain